MYTIYGMDNDMIQDIACQLSKSYNKHRDAAIVSQLATGKTQQVIADQYGIDRVRVAQIKKANQELVSQIANKIISETLPDIYETTKLDIETGKKLAKIAKQTAGELSESQLQYKKQTNKTTENILRSVGILPSSAPSVVFQNITNNTSHNKQLVVSESVLSMFQDQLSTFADVVDEPDNVV